MLAVTLTACGIENPAKSPLSGNEYGGTNYETTMDGLEAAGFVNIETVEETTTAPHLAGTVQSVSIDGRTNYTTGNTWESTVPVVVKYYTLETLDAFMDITDQGGEGKPEFSIETNLPDKTELILTLSNNNLYTEQQTITVKSGKATSEPFTEEHDQPLAGDYTLTVVMEMDEQPYGVKTKLGTTGECLTGELTDVSEVTGNTYLFKEIQYNSAYTEPEAIPAEEMMKLLEDAMQAGFENNFTITLEGYLYTVNVWQDGLAMTAALAQIGNEDAVEEWKQIGVETGKASASLQELLEQNGYGDYMININVLNDENPENILLSAMWGIVTDNCME